MHLKNNDHGQSRENSNFCWFADKICFAQKLKIQYGWGITILSWCIGARFGSRKERKRRMIEGWICLKGMAYVFSANDVNCVWITFWLKVTFVICTIIWQVYLPPKMVAIEIKCDCIAPWMLRFSPLIWSWGLCRASVQLWEKW